MRYYSSEYERYWAQLIARGKRTTTQIGAFMVAHLGFMHGPVPLPTVDGVITFEAGAILPDLDTLIAVGNSGELPKGPAIKRMSVDELKKIYGRVTKMNHKTGEVWIKYVDPGE